MKARVKATGEIVEVEDCGSVFRHGALFHGYKDANGIWIKASDRLPEVLTSVLTYTKYDRLYVAYWNGSDWVSEGEVNFVGLAGVTHWMPIELPKED